MMIEAFNAHAVDIEVDENGFPNRVDRASVALLQHIHPYVYIWSTWQEERQLYFNGYVVVTPQGNLIIDPPLCDEYMLLAFEAIGGVQAIILTNADHERASAEIADTLNIPVWVHEADATLLKRSAQATFKAGDTLLECLTVLPIAHQKTAGETALWWESAGVLFVGDAFISPQHHALRLLAPEKYADVALAKTTLKQVLTPLTPTVAAIFVGDGEPVLTHAPNVLSAFLEE